MQSVSCQECFWKRVERDGGAYDTYPGAPIFCCSDQEWHDPDDCCAFYKEPEGEEDGCLDSGGS